MEPQFILVFKNVVQLGKLLVSLYAKLYQGRVEVLELRKLSEVNLVDIERNLLFLAKLL